MGLPGVPDFGHCSLILLIVVGPKGKHQQVPVDVMVYTTRAIVRLTIYLSGTTETMPAGPVLV